MSLVQFLLDVLDNEDDAENPERQDDEKTILVNYEGEAYAITVEPL